MEKIVRQLIFMINSIFLQLLVLLGNGFEVCCQRDDRVLNRRPSQVRRAFQTGHTIVVIHVIRIQKIEAL
jgi:hypothetical protein